MIQHRVLFNIWGDAPWTTLNLLNSFTRLRVIDKVELLEQVTSLSSSVFLMVIVPDSLLIFSLTHNPNSLICKHYLFPVEVKTNNKHSIFFIIRKSIYKNPLLSSEDQVRCSFYFIITYFSNHLFCSADNIIATTLWKWFQIFGVIFRLLSNI